MKKTPNNDMDRLLVKQLLNEATAAEQEQVAEWCSTAPVNQQYFNDFQRIWEESILLAPSTAPNETEAWERFRQGERFPASRPEPGVVRPLRSRRLLMRVAAALLLLLAGMATWRFIANRSFQQNKDELLSLQARAQPRTDTLPDGTRVTLNKHSLLEYPRQFTGESRTVRLKGEGFFQVVHHASQPFVVRMDGITIQDIGTSFNVKSGKGETEVIVESGEVSVISGSGIINAGPGEKVTVSVSTLPARKTISVDELYQYYRTKAFVCRKTPLWKLVEVLDEAYNVHIAIEGNGTRDLLLTTTFQNETLDNILSILTKTFGLTQVRNRQEIVLKK